MTAALLALAAVFTLCSGAPRVTCVVDGDTFWLDGEKIRIADINAPETVQAGRPLEVAKGHRAKLRLTELLNAGKIELIAADRERDRFGRPLRTVSTDGRNIGALLIAEELSELWRGCRSDWCAQEKQATK